MENSALIRIDDRDLVISREPEMVLEEAQRAAKALTEVINQKRKPVKIGGETYLEFEDWMLIGRFYGISVKVVSTKEIIKEKEIIGYEARAVAILVRTGEEISAAEAMCLYDEKNWKDRPMFMLRSMSQTRACAKAFRNVLAWVVVLAGYKPTPAEEMDGVHNGGHEGQREMEQGGYEEPPEEPPSHPSPSPDGITDKQRGAIFAISKALGINHLDACFKALGRPIEHLERLSKREAGQIIEFLQKARDKRG